MVWTIIIVFIGYIIIRFLLALGKDNDDLQGCTLDDKFNVIVSMINEAAFGGRGLVCYLDKREFNLYQEGQYQIIRFHYSTGHLTITWKYKHFQKEVIHERQFNNVRSLSLFEQQNIGKYMIKEMATIIERHKNNELESII